MKHVLSSLLLLFATATWAQKEVSLSFDLKGVTTGDSITLSWGASGKPVTPRILQVAAKEQQTLRIPLNEPRLIIVGMKGYSGGYELIASPDETISVSGRVKKNRDSYFGSERNKAYSIEFTKMEVTGAAWHQPYQTAMTDYLIHLDSLASSVAVDFREVQHFIKRAKENKDEQAIAGMYQTLVGKEYIERVTGNYDEMNDYFKTLVLRHKDSFLAPLLMLRFGGTLDKSDRALYDALTDDAKQSYYGREVKDAVYPPSLIGNIAPTVTVMTQDQQEKLLSFNHRTNKYLLLDFWASWCEPCLKEVPNLKRIYEKHHANGLDIIGLSVDKNYEDWQETLKEMDEPWCNYIDIDKQAIMEYQVQYIPSIFIMDANGKVIAEKLRGKDLYDFIDKLFAE